MVMGLDNTLLSMTPEKHALKGPVAVPSVLCGPACIVCVQNISFQMIEDLISMACAVGGMSLSNQKAMQIIQRMRLSHSHTIHRVIDGYHVDFSFLPCLFECFNCIIGMNTHRHRHIQDNKYETIFIFLEGYFMLYC